MAAKEENLIDVLIKDPARMKPEFMTNPNMDKLLAAVLRLAMENGVLRDRIARQEQLLKSKNILSNQDYETYEPDSETVKHSQSENFNLIRALAKDLS